MREENILFAVISLLGVLVLLSLVLVSVPKTSDMMFSPGERLSPIDATVNVEDNNAPVITEHNPGDLSLNALGTDDLYFNVTFEDVDGDFLNVKWFVDGNDIKKTTGFLGSGFDEFDFNFGCGVKGDRKVKVEISDGFDLASVEWNIDLTLVACDSGGGSGGGGDGGLANFTVSRDLIDVDLKQGQELTQTLVVKNTGDVGLAISSSFVGSTNLFSVTPINFNLDSGSERAFDIIFDIPSSQQPGINTGGVTFKAGTVSRTVNLIINVLDSGILFDVNSELDSSILLKNDKIFANINMTDISNQGPVVVNTSYFIKDFEDNSFFLGSENLQVNGFLSLDREFEIPKELDYGRYLFYVELSYNDKKASSSNAFRLSPASLWYRALLISIAIILLIIAGLLAYYLYKKNREKKELME
ncbi:hypothetical protein COU62_00320 [Candidatus Pacearchaeota archaeon CG10_big_fil_rev_8_21_14_0_10_35_219]|nr:hypothetical protein [Candidatus Pacearchaeota archaeon]OIO42494.1 MAG: hypothetical protein AUJ63_02740 [Candidatus Pacearchaeota archaeon CG1_02_35_32]PIO08427.1 MAG: hypothetical protein COU62_00320 [Candidatus Pacearchaeota archaeon CG10_big_fil_rev_8_21_14_0_10_35_219]PIY81809.1 MAG: hypothetical protein COY79_00715 [Candidatus Pacearchaeota archaeon CG_4_10_14_0_8_um_filter_35_169]PIZ80073.1 MAG: hypothetical protein COY00_02280 [Candidatus Pacearchaeota archaeon CG_4_10_14_0_2_um_filt